MRDTEVSNKSVVVGLKGADISGVEFTDTLDMGADGG